MGETKRVKRESDRNRGKTGGEQAGSHSKEKRRCCVEVWSHIDKGLLLAAGLETVKNWLSFCRISQ